MKNIWVVILMGLIITGCAGNYKSFALGDIDKDNKTITINAIDREIFDIKSALVENGWRIKIGNQETRKTGRLDKNIDIRTRNTFDTKYRMYISMSYWPRIDLPIASYNITIVENDTNFEILSIVAKRQVFHEHDMEDIAEHLITELKKMQR